MTSTFRDSKVIPEASGSRTDKICRRTKFPRRAGYRDNREGKSKKVRIAPGDKHSSLLNYQHQSCVTGVELAGSWVK